MVSDNIVAPLHVETHGDLIHLCREARVVRYQQQSPTFLDEVLDNVDLGILVLSIEGHGNHQNIHVLQCFLCEKLALVQQHNLVLVFGIEYMTRMVLLHALRISQYICETTMAPFSDVAPTVDVVGIVIGIHGESGKVSIVEHHCDHIGSPCGTQGFGIIRSNGGIILRNRLRNGIAE